MKSRVLAYVRIESRQGRLLVAQDEILGIGSGKDQVPSGTAASRPGMKSRVLAYVRIESRQGRLLVGQG